MSSVTDLEIAIFDNAEISAALNCIHQWEGGVAGIDAKCRKETPEANT